MPNQLYIPTEAALQTPFDVGRAITTQLLGLSRHLKFPIGFGTLDAAVLFTVPTLPPGVAGLYLSKFVWEITTSFTGGSASAIGVSSSNAAYSTKGDLFGGASGDVAATLVSTSGKYKGGTLGTKISGAPGVGILIAGDTLLFNRVTSAFTAGAGFVHIDCAYFD